MEGLGQLLEKKWSPWNCFSWSEQTFESCLALFSCPVGRCVAILCQAEQTEVYQLYIFQAFTMGVAKREFFVSLHLVERLVLFRRIGCKCCPIPNCGRIRFNWMLNSSRRLRHHIFPNCRNNVITLRGFTTQKTVIWGLYDLPYRIFCGTTYYSRQSHKMGDKIS